ncbi:hypothetical protein [Peptostreptococcus porci]|uniref:hypothetical protein n=1 Tax=Peptostreptococcus porci TaxID=2652282 RepID=UPI001A9BF2ED|nr:hypothetical protein [Peptostreptococcus porci]
MLFVLPIDFNSFCHDSIVVGVMSSINKSFMDSTDERICISVDKDKFKQVEVGDLVRR